MSQVSLIASADWANLKKETLSDKPLVIIDSQVDRLESLVQDIQFRTNIVILDSQRDGIEQITQALNQYPDLSSLHLVAHGSPGCLNLGNSQLNLANLNRHASQLTSWAGFLTGKEILVYGCQVAQGEGPIFLEQLSRLTGSNIAASQNVIGLSQSGRYWQLEFQVGSQMMEELIFSPSLQESYTGAFVDYDEASDGDISNDPSDPLALTLEEGSNTISATTGNGEADQEYITVSVPDGSQLDTVVLESFSPVGDTAFIGVQENDVFTEPLDDSADTGNILGYALFGDSGDIGTDILDNIGNGAGAIGFDGPLPSGDYTFALQQLSPPSTYTLNFNVSEVATEPPTDPPADPPTGELPVVSFEVVPLNFSEESEDNLVEWKWTVEGDFPEEGIVVNLETSGGNPDIPFDFTNQFAAEPEAEFINANIVGFDEETGDLNILLEAPEASFQLFFINDIIEEGAQPFNFNLVEGDGYVVDPDQNANEFIITDDNGGAGVGPTVGLSVSATDLAEGDPLTVTFNVAGDIPEGGVEVLVQSGVFGALGQFDLADLSNLELTGIDGLPSVGDGGGGSFFVTITEPTATITTSVFDDIVAEEALELEFTLANGELYEVDPDAASVTLNLADETAPSGPVVGISLDQTDVFEGETITLTFDVAGEIPEGGVTVLVNDVASAGSQLRSLTEFDVANIETTGIEGFPEPAEGDSGFFVNITEPTATITLPVLDDGADEDEAAESFTFEVIDGEAYDADPDASSVTLNITDVGDTPVDPGTPNEPDPEPPTGETPIVSLTVDPALVSEEDEEAFSTATFTVDGEIPEVEFDAEGNYVSGGLSVFFDGETIPLLDEVVGGPILDGLVLGDFFDPEQPSLTEVILLENTSSITLNFINDVIEEADQDYVFTLVNDDNDLLGSNYAVNPDVSEFTLTLVDGNGGPGVGPTVGITATETELTEGDTVTLNFAVDGEIPAEGLEVLVESPTPGAIGEFSIFDEDGNFLIETTGLADFPISADGIGSSFLATITEPDASITLSVFDDGPNEGLEELTFGVVNGEEYEVDPEAAEVALSIDDGGTPVEPPIEPPTEDTFVPVFGSIDGDTIEVEGSSQLIFAGDLNDLIDASTGDGGNRIYAGSGDDTLILGEGDRILAGEGDDAIFATSGGDNTITGGDGADQFWIATAEIPDGINTITDFTDGEDVIGIAGLGIGFSDVSITDLEGDAVIGAAGSDLATLQGVDATSLTEDDFAFG